VNRGLGRRVVFVCGNLEAGGAERQWSLLIPALDARGFDVAVVTLDGRGPHYEELRTAGVEVACAGLRHRADPVGLARALNLGGRRASIVVSRGVSGHLVGHVLALRQRARHVVTEHLGPDPTGLRPYRRHQRLLLSPVRPRVSAVIAVGRSQVDHLVREGYRYDAIRVIPNGLPDDPPVRNRTAVRSEVGVGRDDFLAVVAAALRPEKRVTMFVDQVSAAHAAEPSIHGLVVGDGPEAGAVAGAVERSGGAVRMAGYRADALDIMNAADVVCLTSAVEAAPLSLLEAMSLGRPVVATNVGGVADLVVDGETGLLVPKDHPSALGDALVALARDRARADGLGRAGRSRQQQRFSIDAMVDGYAELVTELAGGRRGRAVVAVPGSGWAG
jgi:glycosyltransferase involved in cell wall biosynthesis